MGGFGGHQDKWNIKNIKTSTEYSLSLMESHTHTKEGGDRKLKNVRD